MELWQMGLGVAFLLAVLTFAYLLIGRLRRREKVIKILKEAKAMKKEIMMDTTELRARQLLISKWLIPAYVFLGIGILILLLEVFGIIQDTGVIGIVIAMNLFTVSFLAGMFIPILIQIYVKLSEISVKLT
ncbi:MAG: hypothetical protein J7K81_01800 [Methanophagales archaeon]|nr:hypothetical protein [Methanophagales archaeon]